nr:transketolase C-terminal domain-containing protein [Phycisphaerales bacterium]
ESREGQVTEALDYIADRKLLNVLPIFNCNEYGQADRVSGQQSADSLTARLTAMGYDVKTIDGHVPSQIKAAFEAFTANASKAGARPIAVVARTVKGWGAASVQGNGWHGKPPVGDALKRALQELDEKRVELTSSLGSGDSFTIQPPAESTRQVEEPGELPSFSETMRRMDMESLLQSGTIATRKAYGIALRAMARTNDRIVVLDADVSNSTFADMVKKDAELADRFVECKIAEQNMFSVGVGLSAGGKIPFCSTFAKFVTRAYDQIEMAINSGANLKIVGSHAGISLASDGPSQMSLPDVAWFRAFTTMKDHRGNPGCYVLQPADAHAAYGLASVMAEYEGVCYLRTLRPETEFIYSDDVVFNLGGFEVLHEGRDILIAATGYMVHEANRAIDLLDKAGISASLVDLYSMPFDSDGVLDLINANNGKVITVEDNYGGGIGSALSDALTESGDAFQLHQMHVRHIPKSARTPEELLRSCGLSADDIKKKAMEMLGV